MVFGDTPQRSQKGTSVVAPRAASLQARFSAAAEAAQTGADTTAFTSFRNAGFALVYANCNDFFWSMGKEQTKAHIVRDAVAPVVTLLTGIIALHDFNKHPDAKENLVQALAIGSAATLAGVGIYQSNFLFGAENIDSVRLLTLQHCRCMRRQPAPAIRLISNRARFTSSTIRRSVLPAISWRWPRARSPWRKSSL